MKRSSGAFLVIALALAGAALSACGGKSYLARAGAPDREIEIDGDPGDWAGRLSAVDGKSTLVGFMNDREFLYLCLVVEDVEGPDPAAAQGLTVWFDPAGGERKTFGVEFPLSPAERRRPDRGGPWRVPTEGENAGQELRLLHEGEPVRDSTLDEAATHGLLIKSLATGGSYVYEMKIPLRETGARPIAIGAAPGSTLGVRFETGKLEMGSLRGPMGFGSPALGRGRKGIPEIPDAIKLRVAVVLGNPAGGEERPVSASLAAAAALD